MCIFSYPHSCILHVEPVAQDYVAVEEEAAEVEVQEELQELEAAEQVENQEFDLANPWREYAREAIIKWLLSYSMFIIDVYFSC